MDLTLSFGFHAPAWLVVALLCPIISAIGTIIVRGWRPRKELRLPAPASPAEELLPQGDSAGRPIV